MAEVHNLIGTSDKRYASPPSEYSSWKEFWEEEKKREFGKCSCEGCSKRATDGSHVQKKSGTDKWYIVPLCHECNIGKKDRNFKVRTDDLVPLHGVSY